MFLLFLFAQLVANKLMLVKIIRCIGSFLYAWAVHVYLMHR